MDRMILPIFGAIFLLLFGAGGMFAWDHHPHVNCCRLNLVVWHPGFDFPKSLAEQRDDAVAAEAKDRAAAKGWQDALLQTERNLEACSAGAAKAKAEGDRRVAEIEGQLRTEEKAAKDAMDSVNSLMAFQPTGKTDCDKAQSMFDYIKKDAAR